MMKLPVLILVGLTFLTLSKPVYSQSEVTAPSSLALSSMFSPLDAPQRKTMGLLQRNFLEMAGGSDTDLEIAIVIDGTESMSAELAGVQESIDRMLSDLKRYRKKEVRTAIVVYRDHGSPSGEVVTPLEKFTSDQTAIDKAVKTLKPESGAPFFHELTDLGLHTAITKLPWSDDRTVTKWILLFGDAPPYSETYQDAKIEGAHRRYSNELIVSLARQKGIRINSVLCTSSDDNVASYEKVIDSTRDFMSQLSTESGGIMLDLSYPAIQKALVEVGKRPEVKYAKIDPITAGDLAAVVRYPNNAQETSDASGAGDLRIAVMPHSPVASMQFDPHSDPVLVATAIRTQFASLPGVRMISPIDVQRQLRRLRADGLADRQIMRGLAGRLGVDYLVWGKVIPQTASIQTAAYRRRDGEQVIQVAFDGDRSKLVDVILTAAAKQPDVEEPLVMLAKRIQSSSLRTLLTEPMAQSSATTAELLSSIEALEQSLEFVAGDEEATALLESARRSAKSATEAEPRNPVAWWLLSNASFNLATGDFMSGRSSEAKVKMSEVKYSLRNAVRHLRRLKSESLSHEIEADEALLVRRDTQAAVEHYQALVSETMPMKSQLRGHWMLAGIYAGDWGVADSIVDLALSRKHIIEILANWPESPEASQLKRWLLWDDQSDQTRHNYLPQIHVKLTESDKT